MKKLNAACEAINRLHTLQADFEKTLALLASLKDGELTLEQVELVDGGWKLAAIVTPVVPLVESPTPETIKQPAVGGGPLEGTLEGTIDSQGN